MGCQSSAGAILGRKFAVRLSPSTMRGSGFLLEKRGGAPFALTGFVMPISRRHETAYLLGPLWAQQSVADMKPGDLPGEYLRLSHIPRREPAQDAICAKISQRPHNFARGLGPLSATNPWHCSRFSLNARGEVRRCFSCLTGFSLFPERSEIL